jgi:sporulation protein YlmC with PRC-barrel domain
MRPLSSFLRRTVVTESGRRLGRCYDLRGELTSSKLRVTALVVGRRGLAEHLGIAGSASATAAPVRHRGTVPWDAVVRLEAGRIVVRDGTEIQ